MVKPIFKPKHAVSSLVKWLISKSKSTDSILIRILIEYTKVYLYTTEYNMYFVFLLVFTLALINLPRYK